MTKKKSMKSYTAAQLKKRKDRSDWARVDAMRDEDIDYSDIPELNESFWHNLRLTMPTHKTPTGLRIDDDLLSWFKKRGKGYQSQINAILRAYMFAHMDGEKR